MAKDYKAKLARKKADIEKDYKIALAKGKDDSVAKAKYNQRMADADDDYNKWTGADRTTSKAAEKKSEVALKSARRTKGQTPKVINAPAAKSSPTPVSAPTPTPAKTPVKYDNMAFGAAFRKAMADKGKGETFTWRGKPYKLEHATTAKKAAPAKSASKAPVKKPVDYKASFGSKKATPAKKDLSAYTKKPGGPLKPKASSPYTKKPGGPLKAGSPYVGKKPTMLETKAKTPAKKPATKESVAASRTKKDLSAYTKKPGGPLKKDKKSYADSYREYAKKGYKAGGAVRKKSINGCAKRGLTKGRFR